MSIDFITERFIGDRAPAVAWRGATTTYGELAERVRGVERELEERGVEPGTIVSLKGDFSAGGIALLLALIQHECIVVPLLSSIRESEMRERLDIAQVEYAFRVDEDESIEGERTNVRADHAFFETIRGRHHPGLVLFTSGSSGEPKAAVHDLVHLLEKFRTGRAQMRTLNFLLFDHWGGLNTMFHILSSKGTVIPVRDRSPDGVCRLVQEQSIQLLPASPTFLNLLLISEAYRRHDLSSLELITYGTEPMALSTLQRLRAVFPHVRFKQTYGLIELGVLHSKSKSDDSLWVKVGGDGYETRVVEGILQIKARSAMLGYLNAPSPFTDDGWFVTGDAVEVDGEYLRILGRKSEVINVGGEKVYPTEVENVVLGLENIEDVTVYGEKNPITGNIVCATVRLGVDEDEDELTSRIRRHCKQHLQSFKVPIKVRIATDDLHGTRFKKRRTI